MQFTHLDRVYRHLEDRPGEGRRARRPLLDGRQSLAIRTRLRDNS